MERTDEGQEKLDYVRLLRPVERDTHVRRGPAWLMHGHGVQIKRREVMHHRSARERFPSTKVSASFTICSQFGCLFSSVVWLASLAR